MSKRVGKDMYDEMLREASDRLPRYGCDEGKDVAERIVNKVLDIQDLAPPKPDVLPDVSGGDWYYELNDGYLKIYADKGAICRVYLKGVTTEVKANARVMAASKELVEAVVEYLDGFKSECRWPWMPELLNIIDIVEKAGVDVSKYRRTCDDNINMDPEGQDTDTH